MRGKTTLAWVIGGSVVGLGAGCELIAGLGDPKLDNTALCSDGIKDGNETSKDCGGGCGPCQPGEGCLVGADCQSKLCTGGTCLAPACDDKVQNEDETDVDCGGACSPCQTDRRCTVSGDCQSGVCVAGVCKTFHVWSKRFGSLDMMSACSVSSVAADDKGDTLIAGGFETNIDLGPGTQPIVAPQGMFAAKFSPSGDLLWSAGVEGTQSASPNALVVDDANDLVMVGGFLGNITIGATPHTSAGYQDIFVAKLDGSVGVFDWSLHFGGTDVEYVFGAAVDGSRNVILTGAFHSNAITFGGAALSSANGLTYLAKLDPSGAHLWSKNFAASEGARVAVDSAASIILAGGFVGAVDFGGAPLTSAGASDVFVAKLGPSGSLIWSKRFGNAQDEHVDQVAVDTAGGILISGQFTKTLDFGGGTLNAPGSAVFLVKLDSSGNYVWGTSIDQTNGTIFVSQIAVGSAGDVAITGQLDGTVELDGGALVSAGDRDAFVAMFDATGKYVFGRRFGDGQRQSSSGAVFSAEKELIVTGNLQGIIDLGGGPLITMGYQDVFLAKLSMP